MRHRLRLGAPAAAFSVIGGVLLAVGTTSDLRMVGGFTTSGAYALALQIVLSLLLLAVIDDLREPPPMRAATRWGGRQVTINSGLRSDLWQFYLGNPFASAALAFGLATSTGVLLSGLLDGSRMLDGAIAPSAAPMAVLMVATALAQLPGRALAFLGWCTGFAAGGVLTQIRFVPGIDVDRTSQLAIVLVITLILVRTVIRATYAPRQRPVNAGNISREQQ